MIAIGKHVHVVILDAGEVEVVEESQRVLKVDVVVGDAVHEEEALVLAEGRGVADAWRLVAVGVLVWGVRM